MTSSERQLYAVIRQVRTCFNQLKALAEQLHQGLGINPSMRAVMESLNREGARTVPDIAKEKGVSRQHIQNVMNALVTEEYVESFDNPAHKRSVLFNLTSRGRATFDEMQEREKQPLRRLAESMGIEDLRQVEAVLKDLNHCLESELTRGNSDEVSSRRT